MSLFPFSSIIFSIIFISKKVKVNVFKRLRPFLLVIVTH